MIKTNHVLSPLVFTVIVFLSSFLIFTIEPMQAKQLLPFLGGVPTVWTGCLLFYQVVLLLGYLYAYVLSRLSFKTQCVVHSLVLILSFFGFLWPSTLDVFSYEHLLKTHPKLWLTVVLTTSIGYKFFILASTSSLMQNWFSRVESSRSTQPYFLYAASNFGSLLGVLLYPLWIEPSLRMQTQTWLWSMTYGLLVLGLLGLSLKLRYVLFKSGQADLNYVQEPKDSVISSDIQEWKKQFLGSSSFSVIYWLLYAFIPSSLMLGATTFISVDIASFPFLWSGPLFLYILSFVIVFSFWSPKLDKYLTSLLPWIQLILLCWASASKWNIIFLHLVFLFLVCLACHGRLFLLKPKVDRLTSFYFYLSLGGVLGGLFNVLIAPYLFEQILEYALVLILALLVCVPLYTKGKFRFTVLIERGSYFISLGVITVMIINILKGSEIFSLNILSPVKTEIVLHQERSFFGVLKIVKKVDFIHTLKNGTIVHGEQRIDSEEHRREPLSYYHKDGPLGDIFNYINTQILKPNIAAIGLGVGTIAAYGTPENKITFFELNPHVVEVAKNPNWFSYMNECEDRGCHLKTVVGDGRIELSKSKESYDLIVLDAFSSDSIPTHLLTVEAMRLYQSKLNPTGVIALHITNKYIDLEPVISTLAETLNLQAVIRKDSKMKSRERRQSVWVALSSKENAILNSTNLTLWSSLQKSKKTRLWTDDYVDVLSFLKFNTK